MSDSIVAYFYQYIYLFIVLILSIPIMHRYLRHKNVPEQLCVTDNQTSAFLLAIMMTVFIGLRPIHEVFADMPQYLGIYLSWDDSFEFSWDRENYFYDNLMLGLASIQFNPTLFYVLISFIYFMCTYWACKRLFPNNTLTAFLVFLAAFSTFSYGTNGIKAGSAAAIFLVALSYRDNLKICALWMFISLGFHHSMVLPIVAFVITLIVKNPKIYFYGWIFSVLMACLHITFFQSIFAGMAEESGAGYLGANGYDDTSYLTGFRPDFILYSSMPVFVGYVAKIKKRLKSRTYDTLLYTYMTTNAVWMLCMYASYTNRIAYLSWFLYPIVLIYPFFDAQWGPNRYSTLSKVMIGHLAFTLFMSMIYYGGFVKLFGLISSLL